MAMAFPVVGSSAATAATPRAAGTPAAPAPASGFGDALNADAERGHVHRHGDGERALRILHTLSIRPGHLQQIGDESELLGAHFESGCL